MKAAGVKLFWKCLKGSPPAFADLLAGRIDLFFDSIAGACRTYSRGRPGASPCCRRGAVRLRLTCRPCRSWRARFDVDSCSNLRTPQKPGEIIAKLRRYPRLVARPQGALEKSGGGCVGLPNDRLDAFVVSEYENWTKLIRRAGIKLD